MRLDHITSSGLGLDDNVDENPKTRYVTRPYVRQAPHPYGWRRSNRLPGEISAVVPPVPIPNTEVKRSCADGSVA